MPTLRERILNRIEEIRKHENGFPKGIKKWDNFSTGIVKTHLSELDFSEGNDTELLFLFERLIKRYYTQY